MRFSDTRYRPTLHISCGKMYDESPICLQFPNATSYDKGFYEYLNIGEAEEFIKYLADAISKAKLLKKDEVEDD